jgi:hypothetical protein
MGVQQQYSGADLCSNNILALIWREICSCQG